MLIPRCPSIATGCDNYHPDAAWRNLHKLPNSNSIMLGPSRPRIAASYNHPHSNTAGCHVDKLLHGSWLQSL
jgi:hypothetical protein